MSRQVARRVDIDKLTIPQSRNFVNGFMRKDEVHLIWREKQARHHSKIKPSWYFFVRSSDASRHRKLLLRLRKNGYIQRFAVWKRNHEYVRVFCENKNLYGSDLAAGQIDGKTIVLSALEEAGLPTFEADLTPLQRVMVDKELKIATQLRVAYFDIETKDVGHDGKRIPIEVDPRGRATGATPILSFAIQYRNGKVVYYKAKSDKPIHEKELLQQMFGYLSKIDVAVTFNGTNFDIPFCQGRARRYDMWFDWKKLIHVDVCDQMRQIHLQNTEISSYSLEFLSQHFLGEGKVEHPGMTTWDMFQFHPELLKRYNIRDVELLWRLDEHEKVVKFMLYQCRMCGIFLSQFGSYNLIDGYILRQGQLEGEPLPTAIHPEKIGKFRGAYVVEVKPGLYRNVAVFDFKGLYPSIIRTWNIGPDTLIQGEPPDDVAVTKSVLTDIDGRPAYFRLSPKSALNRAVTAFGAERTRCKARMKEIVAKLGKEKAKDDKEYQDLDLEQTAWKLRGNSTYGITAAGNRSHNRYFAREVAESITMGGRELHHLTEAWLDQHFGIPVIAGDTDSVFVPLAEHAPQHILDNFHQDLPGILKERYGCPESFIELEHEKVYRKLLLFKKKNYAGLVAPDDKFEGKGLSFVKRENPEVAKKIVKALIDSLLRSDNEAGFYWGWLQKIKKKILHDAIPSEALEHFVIHKKLNKALDNYKTKGIHVYIGEDLRAAGHEVHQGLVVRFVFVVPDGSREGTREDALDIDEFKMSGRELDRQKYWRIYILGKIKPILELVFPNVDWESFDDHVVAKRDMQIAKWEERLQDEKQAWRWFRKVLAEVEKSPWLVDEERERLFNLLDPDEQFLLQAKLKKSIDRRLAKMDHGRPIDGPCPTCGRSALCRGTHATEKYINDVTVCTHCGHEAKKQTRRDDELE